MKTFTLNIPISKVDEEQRIVYGYATKEELDRQGDIVDYEASKKAFSAWAGNIREQHDPKRVIGKKVSMDFDDDEKQVMVGAYISKSPDGENAWTKVKEGLFTGFSIGGKIKSIVKEKTMKGDEEVSANRIMDYDLAELSLVDVPACPSAQLVMVKSVDGKAEEVEELHTDITSPWFMKSYAYAPDQVNRLPETSDNQSMEKKDYSDKERKAMAESGEALPDGSFPIKTVQDLKNAIKAYGRASDPEKAKAHIIKRAKALGKTDLLPEDWNVKGVDAEMTKADESIEKVNVMGGEERDANGEPVKPEEKPEDKKVEKVNVVDGEERDSNGEPVKAPEEKPAKEVKKGLYTVADLAACIENLQYIVQSAEFEAQYEGDGSDVPAKLKAAVAQVGAVLVEMTAEEVAEAAGGDDVEVEEVELADRPADLKKMVAQELEATQGALLKAVGDAVAGKVAEVIKPLEDRMKLLESQPASGTPKREYAVVDKVADKPDAQDETLQKAADMEAHPEKYTVFERAELASELFKRSSYSRPINVK